MRTGIAIRGAVGRRDGILILSTVGVSYLIVYLWGLGHLNRTGTGGFDLMVVDDPIARMTESMGPFIYEPVALLTLGTFEVLLSPINLLIGIGLASLVGLNLAVSWVAWRGPSACRIGPGAGLAAGLPGLLSGFACCGPAILLVIGVQATAGIITAFQWFLPFTIVLLVGTLLWVGNQVEPVKYPPPG